MSTEKAALIPASSGAAIKKPMKVDGEVRGEVRGQSPLQEGSNVLPEIVTTRGDAGDVVQLPNILRDAAVVRQLSAERHMVCFRTAPRSEGS